MKIYENLIEIGLKLLDRTQKLINDYDSNKLYSIRETDASFDIVVEYHKWVKSVNKSLKSNPKNKIQASFFKEADGVPTLDWLDDHQYINGDFIPLGVAEKILSETKNKLKHIRLIAHQGNKGSVIILQINKERMEVIRKGNEKSRLLFRKRAGKNNRFKYLLKISENKKVPSEDLMELTRTRTIQNLSKEIGHINKALRKSLGLRNNLIINNSGYEINNEIFDIEFI